MTAQILAESLKCECCGAQLEYTQASARIVCAYCGDIKVISFADDDRADGEPASQSNARYIVPMELTFEDIEYQMYVLLSQHKDGQSDLMEKARIVKREMMYVPVYLADDPASADANALKPQYAGTLLTNAPLNPLALVSDIFSKRQPEKFSASYTAGCSVEDIVLGAAGVKKPGEDFNFQAGPAVQCDVPLCYLVFIYRDKIYHLWMDGIKGGRYLMTPLPVVRSQREAIFGPYLATVIVGLIALLLTMAVEKGVWVGQFLAILTNGLATINYFWRIKGLPQQRKDRLAQAYEYYQRRRKQYGPGQDTPLFQMPHFKRSLFLFENGSTSFWFVIGIVEMIIAMVGCFMAAIK